LIFTDKFIFEPISVGNVHFRNPFYVASGPTTKNVEQLIRAEETGWGGASIKLTIAPEPYINREPRYGYFAEHKKFTFTTEKRLHPDEGLRLIEEGRKRTTELVILANITYAGDLSFDEGWGKMARDFENAGAHAIELNMCCPNMSFNLELSNKSKSNGPRTGASLGQDPAAVAMITKAVKEAVSIPVFVKLTPEGGNIADVTKACFEAGADVVGGTANRMAVPPIDIYHPETSPFGLQKEISMACHSGEWIKPLGLRDVYEMRKLIGDGPKLVGVGGIRTASDVVEMALMGANFYGICTETILSGFGFLEGILDDLRTYKKEMNYQSLDEIRGSIVDKLESAKTVTLYQGYAQIKDRSLSAPCVTACPNYVPSQGYVMAVANRDFKKAFDLITDAGPFQSVCGYACDHPCEDACTRGEMDESVKIKEIKRFVLEYGKKQGWQPERKIEGDRLEKIAVIGAGPAGLSAAHYLAIAGYKVKVFEKHIESGGMLRYGIPRYRLPQEIIDYEVEMIQNLGVEIETNKALGNDFTIAGLKETGYRKILIATGAQQSMDLGLAGENSEGVVSALDFLEIISDGEKPETGKKVAVIGGGFSAIDVARSCKRLGSDEVFLLYRRTRDEMPATGEEVIEAEEEGVKIMYLVSPKEIISENGKVTGIRMINHVLGEADSSSRRKPIEVEGTEFTLAVDMVIPAVGQKTESGGSEELEQLLEWGKIKNNSGITDSEDVLVAGDAATGAKDIIGAVADGRRAAIAIDQAIAGNEKILQPINEQHSVDVDDVLQRSDGIRRQKSQTVTIKESTERVKDFELYSETLTEEAAVEEASRCLNCGCGEGCLLCVDLCNAFAIEKVGSHPLIDEEECVACGTCVWRCPNDNIELIRK